MAGMRIGRAMALAAALAAGAAHAAGPVGALRFIGEQRIPHRLEFQGTVVGGLSGIDYDPGQGIWILASDDRTGADAARYYTATLAYDARTFSNVVLTAVLRLARPEGGPYPALPWNGATPDVESMRVDPADGSLWYASEGDGLLAGDPAVVHVARSGRYLDALSLPALFRMPAPDGGTGPRGNLAFEGLAFAPDGKSLWVAMEAPLRQDGPPPSPSAGALARITQFGRDGAVLRQIAYPLDPIPAAPGPGRHADNGVSEILALDDERLLVLERAAIQDAQGRYANDVRLYEVDVAGATDTSGLASLAGAAVRPATKRRVAGLPGQGPARVDNLEGMAWGPRLPNGHDTLVLVSDDNFNASQVTQLLAFEVLPRRASTSATPAHCGTCASRG